MDAAAEIREFLTSRRARVTPDVAGLPTYGSRRRRVAGLRRDEVALLAGISVEYYTRLERGSGVAGVSEEIVESVARALRLDDAERAHLFDLLRGTDPRRTSRRRPPRQKIRPAVQRILDGLVGVPAYVRNGRLDLLAANALGRALYAPVFDRALGTPNMARFLFFDSGAAEFFPQWEEIAGDAVAILHSQAGRDPYDPRLTELVGELSTRSDDFRTRWARHDVKFHRTGEKQLAHPVVGLLTLSYEALELPDDRQRILAYTPEPGSASAERLRLLATWLVPRPAGVEEHG